MAELDPWLKPERATRRRTWHPRDPLSGALIPGLAPDSWRLPVLRVLLSCGKAPAAGIAASPSERGVLRRRERNRIRQEFHRLGTAPTAGQQRAETPLSPTSFTDERSWWRHVPCGPPFAGTPTAARRPDRMVREVLRRIPLRSALLLVAANLSEFAFIARPSGATPQGQGRTAAGNGLLGDRNCHMCWTVICRPSEAVRIIARTHSCGGSLTTLPSRRRAGCLLRERHRNR